MESLFEVITTENFETIEVKERCPRVERVPATGGLQGYVLSKHVYGIKVHYAMGRSHLCTGNKQCELCKHYKMDRYGLIGLRLHKKNRTIWGQIPMNAVKAFMLGVKVLQRPILGTYVVFEREWEGTNAPVRVSIPPTEQKDIKVTLPLTPEMAIERAFVAPKSGGKPRLKAV